MKKLLALALVILMVFSLVACGTESAKDDTGSDSAKVSSEVDEAAKKIEEYVDKNGKDLIESVERSFTGSSGVSCKSTIKAEGRGFIININIEGYDNVDAEAKQALQDTYDGMSDTFQGMLKTMQKELPELEYFEFRICEEDGDLLATIHAEE